MHKTSLYTWACLYGDFWKLEGILSVVSSTKFKENFGLKHANLPVKYFFLGTSAVLLISLVETVVNLGLYVTLW